MPRDFLCEPCAAQRESMEALGFSLIHTSTHTAGAAQWGGHGLIIEVREQTPLSLYQAADLVICATRADTQRKIQEALGLKPRS